MAFSWTPKFTQGDPFDQTNWVKRDAKIGSSDGKVVFEQKNVEVPEFWSQTATDIVASKYFSGKKNTPQRENSIKQLINRVAKTISGWSLKDGYFENEESAQNFENDLKWLLVNQYASFNSPVWFNVGVIENPQCSACQPFHALVSTPEGMLPIGEIVTQKQIGKKVYDSNGTTKVIAVKENGKKRVYKITLANGTYIEATGDHLVKSVSERRTKPFWIRVDQLKLGIRLHLFPHRDGFFSEQKENKKEISEAALAGWLQADGFIGQYAYGTNRSLTAEFETVNKDEKEWVLQHIASVFPDTHYHERKVIVQNQALDYRRIRIYGKILRNFVNKYNLLTPWTEKRVPPELFTAEKEIVSAYLKSIFQADGYISRDGTSSRIGFAVINPKWADDIQLLLLRCGIYSRRYEKKDKRLDRKTMNVVEISIGSERQKFFDLIGFISKEKQTKLLDSLKISEKKNCPDLREERIVKIEDIGVQEVYDIQTQSGEYLSNNIAIHNCFILSVEDDMRSILYDWYAVEGKIFRGGSGSGINVSKLRSSKEQLSKGGYASGPVSFMGGADGIANSIKSGGRTRRAAKMVVLDVDHPDIKDFIYCKHEMEEMAKVLAQTGKYDTSLDGKLFSIYTTLPFQNANNSVRITDEFMEKVLADEDWGLKARTNEEIIEKTRAREILEWCADAAWHSADPGMQYDTTINKWHTCPNSGRINASNPCSEYMHLDNSACNLASLNLLRFLKEDGNFDIELYKKATATMILAQDILIDNSSYPTEKITQNAKNFRQLGLGFANLGALLMTLGLPYDSDEGRAYAGILSALYNGEAYRMSAEIAKHKGSFAGYEINKEPMLNVIKMHREEAYKISENLVEQKELLEEAKNVWNKALLEGQEWGYRNSQVSVIAPTGTIAFMMDCGTTGVEPAIALISYKKLVGGGMLRLVNNQVARALSKLGYSENQIKEIVDYIDKNDTIEDAPHLKKEHLAVFDCSFKAAKGTRSIHYLGHLKMMGAVQPFVSGAISKTVNLPKDATKEEMFNAFIEAWRLGIKAVAFYRDGSKTVQPLSTEKEETKALKIPKLMRRYLPNERPAIHHKFSIAGHEGYVNVGLYPEDYKVGETFINMAKEGSTISGLMDAIAILTSISLQYGIPLKVLVKKMKDMRFEPMGITASKDIPFASSIVDYIFKYLGIKFLTDEEKVEIFGAAPVANGNGHEVIELKPAPSIDGPNGLETIMAKFTQMEDEQNSPQPALALAETTTENPLCSKCGFIMYRAGTCMLCRNCGEVTGVCS
ncbi:MAG: vitamin B12-dependent ribonucleotide reductase [Patescibacteria group bacterium]